MYEFTFTVTDANDKFQLVTTLPRKVIPCTSNETLSSVDLDEPCTVFVELTKKGHDVADTLIINVPYLFVIKFFIT